MVIRDIDIFNEIFSLENLDRTYLQKKQKYLLQTSGIDRKTINIFERDNQDIFRIINEKTRSFKYTFSPYVESLILKGRKEPRVISIPTIKDRLTLELIKQYLNNKIPFCRKLANTHIRNIKKFINSHEKSTLCFERVDIKKFYASINHMILNQYLINRGVNDFIIDLIKKAIATPTVNKLYYSKNEVSKNNTGLPEGLSISNALAELYLTDIDSLFADNLDDYLYLRYVDDILFIFKKDSTKFNNLKTQFRNKLEQLNLSINEDKEKSHSGSINNNKFCYLGYEYSNGKFFAKKQSEIKFTNSIIKLFTVHKYTKNQLDNENLRLRIFIEDLNDKLTGAISQKVKYGWIFFYSEITDVKFLYQLDSLIDNLSERISLNLRSEKTFLKKISKAFFKLKSQNLTYCRNYDTYTIEEKIEYLVGRVKENRDELLKKNTDFIEELFTRVIDEKLSYLEKDNGLEYK
jgi:RNA-directed DNA polymerase